MVAVHMLTPSVPPGLGQRWLGEPLLREAGAHGAKHHQCQRHRPQLHSPSVAPGHALPLLVARGTGSELLWRLRSSIVFLLCVLCSQAPGRGLQDWSYPSRGAPSEGHCGGGSGGTDGGGGCGGRGWRFQRELGSECDKREFGTEH